MTGRNVHRAHLLIIVPHDVGLCILVGAAI